MPVTPIAYNRINPVFLLFQIHARVWRDSEETMGFLFEIGNLYGVFASDLDS